MKSIFLKLMLSALCATFMFVTAGAQQRSEAPLTNAAVIKLVRAGFKEKTVIAIIRSRPNKFQLEPERLIELKRSGVSENIILNMLALGGSDFGDIDDWDTDSPLFPNKGGANPNAGNGSPGGGIDIFGSGGSSNSQTRGRGFKGGNQEETTTTGSATVRIIRPPTEAGGSSLKLERTPTLTNDSIVNLVEAGFSEGTIIKRIADSPAEFDLSPAKLEELRKRRVSEPIITAMTAAMEGVDGQSPGSTREN
jgi:hypothetical protein